MVIYEGFQIKPHKQNPTSLIVATDGKGGSIPSALEGMYTNVNVAKRAIDTYIVNKLKVEDGKKPSKKVSQS